jgi:DNA mismatch repair protein MutS
VTQDLFTSGAAETPLMQQYREIKARHTDAVLFFRMGDFYETFFDDAHVASRELGLTLTSRNNGAAARVPLAGVPVKAAGEYVRRLVERGYRVAICEQIEDPRFAKGVVRREVVEVVSPGAILAHDWLDQNRNNYLVAFLPGEPSGLAALDLSTGEFMLELAPRGEEETAVLRYDPRELVMPEGAAPVVRGGGAILTARAAREFEPVQGAQDLARHFGLATLEGLGIGPTDQAAVGAAAALVRYVLELQPSGVPQVARPLIRRPGDTMPLDDMTRRNLELVEPLRAGESGATLLEAVDRTVTPMGARLLRQWLLAPLRSRGRIAARLDAVDVLARDGAGRARLRDALAGVRDIERLVSRAVARRATPRDLGALGDSLARLPEVQAATRTLSDVTASAELAAVADDFDSVPDVAARFARVLVPHPPAQFGDGDTVRPGADAELDEARELRDGGKRYIAGLQATERERTGIPSLKVGYNRVFGYYIEITKAHRASVPPHYERRQTLTGAERYVTPELKEYEARVLGAEEHVLERERAIVDDLCRAIGAAVARLQAAGRAVAALDVYQGFATVAAQYDYARPEITDGMELDLRRCRHPVVERVLPPGKFVPNDLRLDDAARIILLTGPNMAGKSTILRQAGHAVILAHAGSFVPAAAATLGIVDRVFTRVGASDALGRGQSTFMVEMHETSAILNGATERSLVLLDEIGRGTATFDGVAIAWAVTEYLHDRIGCKTIFATHYHEITQLTEELQHARNYNVAVREAGDDIVFLHRLEPGGADRSYGIHVGRLAGLPPEVVRRAWEILALLEAGHHVAGAPAPAPPDAHQLALFAATEHPALKELLTLDPNNMTPLEALARLADLKRKFMEDER